MNLVVELVQTDQMWRLKTIDDRNIPISSLNDFLNEVSETITEAFVIDLSELESIDSRGMGMLINIHKKLSPKNIDIILQGPNERLRRFFRIMQFDRIFTIT